MIRHRTAEPQKLYNVDHNFVGLHHECVNKIIYIDTYPTPFLQYVLHFLDGKEEGQLTFTFKLRKN